jgi:hypothetical protein
MNKDNNDVKRIPVTLKAELYDLQNLVNKYLINKTSL